jgi:hypothetical protein
LGAARHYTVPHSDACAVRVCVCLWSSPSRRGFAAVGVVLPFALCGKEQTGALMACAAELGLEALVRVSDSAQLADALSLDAQMVVIGDCTLTEATELLAALPEGKAAPVTVADLAFLDVRGAWKLRDAGYARRRERVDARAMHVCERARGRAACEQRWPPHAPQHDATRSERRPLLSLSLSLSLSLRRRLETCVASTRSRATQLQRDDRRKVDARRVRA